MLQRMRMQTKLAGRSCSRGAGPAAWMVGMPAAGGTDAAPLQGAIPGKPPNPNLHPPPLNPHRRAALRREKTTLSSTCTLPALAPPPPGARTPPSCRACWPPAAPAGLWGAAPPWRVGPTAAASGAAARWVADRERPTRCECVPSTVVDHAYYSLCCHSHAVHAHACWTAADISAAVVIGLHLRIYGRYRFAGQASPSLSAAEGLSSVLPRTEALLRPGAKASRLSMHLSRLAVACAHGCMHAAADRFHGRGRQRAKRLMVLLAASNRAREARMLPRMHSGPYPPRLLFPSLPLAVAHTGGAARSSDGPASHCSLPQGSSVSAPGVPGDALKQAPRLLEAGEQSQGGRLVAAPTYAFRSGPDLLFFSRSHVQSSEALGAGT